jgi:predicted site-specific integrase-resolvase
MKATEGKEWLTLREVSQRRRVHYRTAVRWVNVGVFGVKLRATSNGCRYMTCNDWLDAFDRGVGKARTRTR